MRLRCALFHFELTTYGVISAAAGRGRYGSGMTQQQEWWDWVRPREDGGAKELPHRVPARPSVVYKNSGWVDYDDWLGVSTDVDTVSANPDTSGPDADANASGDGRGEVET
jgi:hypothetical protein